MFSQVLKETSQRCFKCAERWRIPPLRLLKAFFGFDEFREVVFGHGIVTVWQIEPLPGSFVRRRVYFVLDTTLREDVGTESEGAV
jgi:hypothetical protein